MLVGEVNATAGGPAVRQPTEGSETVVVDETGAIVLGLREAAQSVSTRGRSGRTFLEKSRGIGNFLLVAFHPVAAFPVVRERVVLHDGRSAAIDQE